MKIFISMPMKSKSTDQVKTERDNVFEFIKSKLPESELIDSVIDGADKEIALKGDDIGCWYLGESIKMLAGADIVFFVNNWKDFRGCSAERNIANAYKKFCVDIEVNY